MAPAVLLEAMSGMALAAPLEVLLEAVHQDGGISAIVPSPFHIPALLLHRAEATALLP